MQGGSPASGRSPTPPRSTASSTGATTISRSTTRATSSPPGRARRRAHRPQGAGRRGARARGIGLPLLIRFSDILQGPHRRAERGVPARHRRVRLQGRLPGRLPDQGQPGPLRRRGDRRVRPALPLRPRGGLQARAARRHGHARGRGSAHHLQRLQGRGVHRDGAPRLEARPHVILVVEKPSELPLIARDRQAHRACGRASACAPSCPPRGAGHWEASGGDRSKFGLVGARAARRRRASCARTTCSTASSCCTSTSAARSPSIRCGQERAARGGALLRRARQDGRAAAATSTSAAASASTTTARRPTSPRR